MSDGDRLEQGQLGKLSDQLQALTKTVVEYTTVTRRHVGQQEGINERLFELLSGQDKRLRTLEQWRAVKDATLPERLLDGDLVEKDIQGVKKQIELINRVIAKWAGIAVCGMWIVQIFGGRVLDWLGKLIPGGGV